ncbi:hypothetical protein PLESTM_000432200 [Pleodorina starrii]|nr:hypothetical protein PLESTM_000432200 [Pleodorina starrii]
MDFEAAMAEPRRSGSEFNGNQEAASAHVVPLERHGLFSDDEVRAGRPQEEAVTGGDGVGDGVGDSAGLNAIEPVLQAESEPADAQQQQQQQQQEQAASSSPPPSPLRAEDVILQEPPSPSPSPPEAGLEDPQTAAQPDPTAGCQRSPRSNRLQRPVWPPPCAVWLEEANPEPPQPDASEPALQPSEASPVARLPLPRTADDAFRDCQPTNTPLSLAAAAAAALHGLHTASCATVPARHHYARRSAPCISTLACPSSVVLGDVIRKIGHKEVRLVGNVKYGLLKRVWQLEAAVARDQAPPPAAESDEEPTSALADDDEAAAAAAAAGAAVDPQFEAAPPLQQAPQSAVERREKEPTGRPAGDDAAAAADDDVDDEFEDALSAPPSPRPQQPQSQTMTAASAAELAEWTESGPAQQVDAVYLGEEVQSVRTPQPVETSPGACLVVMVAAVSVVAAVDVTREALAALRVRLGAAQARAARAEGAAGRLAARCASLGGELVAVREAAVAAEREREKLREVVRELTARRQQDRREADTAGEQQPEEEVPGELAAKVAELADARQQASSGSCGWVDSLQARLAAANATAGQGAAEISRLRSELSDFLIRAQGLQRGAAQSAEAEVALRSEAANLKAMVEQLNAEKLAAEQHWQEVLRASEANAAAVQAQLREELAAARREAAEALLRGRRDVAAHRDQQAEESAGDTRPCASVQVEGEPPLASPRLKQQPPQHSSSAAQQQQSGSGLASPGARVAAPATD